MSYFKLSNMYLKIIITSAFAFMATFSWYIQQENQSQISELRSEIITLETMLTEANASIQKHFNFMTSVWKRVSENSRNFAPRNHKHPIDCSTKLHEHVDYSSAVCMITPIESINILSTPKRAPSSSTRKKFILIPSTIDLLWSS